MRVLAITTNPLFAAAQPLSLESLQKSYGDAIDRITWASKYGAPVFPGYRPIHKSSVLFSGPVLRGADGLRPILQDRRSLERHMRFHIGLAERKALVAAQWSAKSLFELASSLKLVSPRKLHEYDALLISALGFEQYLNLDRDITVTDPVRRLIEQVTSENAARRRRDLHVVMTVAPTVATVKEWKKIT